MIILRPSSLDDVETLTKLGRESFCAAFAHFYKQQDLDAFLAQAYTQEAVAQEIADPSITHQLALDDSGQLTGFIKMRHPSSYAEHSDARDPITLCQLYTDPTRTGEGIGARLMDWALDLARTENRGAIQLSVWSENFGAQKFYQRYGFTKIADIDFYVGSHRDDEFLYELRLK